MSEVCERCTIEKCKYCEFDIESQKERIESIIFINNSLAVFFKY